MNLLALPIARFCDAVYAWCLQRTSDRDRFDMQLNMPIPGRAASERETQAELDGFASFMDTMGGR